MLRWKLRFNGRAYAAQPKVDKSTQSAENNSLTCATFSFRVPFYWLFRYPIFPTKHCDYIKINFNFEALRLMCLWVSALASRKRSQHIACPIYSATGKWFPSRVRHIKCAWWTRERANARRCCVAREKLPGWEPLWISGNGLWLPTHFETGKGKKLSEKEKHSLGIMCIYPAARFQISRNETFAKRFSEFAFGRFSRFFIRVDFFAYDFLPEKWEFRARLRGGNFKVSCPWNGCFECMSVSPAT